MTTKNKPITLEASIHVMESTDDLMKEAAAIVEFPKNKTPDVLFFSGCFVSSGENLNHAYFMPSELVKAYHTIVNKPLDIEHNEEEIVGHIYSSAFVDQLGNKVEVSDLSKMDQSGLDKSNLDIMICGIVYKSRFPELAEEIKNNKWKLSMETYFQSYDVKVGNLILSKKEAESMGLASTEVVGKMAKIVKRGVEIAAGEVARVLRDMMFSGCGIVKQPANPRSLIFETAKKREEDNVIIVELDPTSEVNKMEKDKSGIDINDNNNQTSVGICVSYKKQVLSNDPKDESTTVSHENWCAKYDASCTSASRDTTDSNCLYVKVMSKINEIVASKICDSEATDRRGQLLQDLKQVLQIN
jgi:hypothetical protein